MSTLRVACGKRVHDFFSANRSQHCNRPICCILVLVQSAASSSSDTKLPDPAPSRPISSPWHERPSVARAQRVVAVVWALALFTLWLIPPAGQLPSSGRYPQETGELRSSPTTQYRCSPVRLGTPGNPPGVSGPSATSDGSLPLGLQAQNSRHGRAA